MGRGAMGVERNSVQLLGLQEVPVHPLSTSGRLTCARICSFAPFALPKKLLIFKS